jgi:hypothetical protein
LGPGGVRVTQCVVAVGWRLSFKGSLPTALKSQPMGVKTKKNITPKEMGLTMLPISKPKRVHQRFGVVSTAGASTVSSATVAEMPSAQQKHHGKHRAKGPVAGSFHVVRALETLDGHGWWFVQTGVTARS